MFRPKDMFHCIVELPIDNAFLLQEFVKMALCGWLVAVPVPQNPLSSRVVLKCACTVACGAQCVTMGGILEMQLWPAHSWPANME